MMQPDCNCADCSQDNERFSLASAFWSADTLYPERAEYSASIGSPPVKPRPAEQVA
jgi:hypothetical protein